MLFSRLLLWLTIFMTMWSQTLGQVCSDLTEPSLGIISYDMGTVDDRPENTVATYSCFGNGVYLSGDSTRTCMSDGMWSGSDPTCLAGCLDIYSMIVNGTVTYDGGTTNARPIGVTATFACDPGLFFIFNSGTVNRVCQSDRTWSGRTPVCTYMCADLAVPANSIVVYTGRSNGSPDGGFPGLGVRPAGIVATYSCEPGFVLVGSATRICLSTTWSGSEPSCQMNDTATPPAVTMIPTTNQSTAIYVDLPQPPNGVVNYNGAGSTNNRPVGTFATVSCSPGYGRSQGDASRVCQSNGQWSGSQLVCVRDCGSPPAVSNGNHTSPSNTLQDSRVTYNFEATCQADGSWSNVPNSLASSDSTAAVIGGVVAIAIVTVAITVIIVVVLILRHKKSGKMPVSTDVQLSPVAPPTYDVMPGEYEEIPANKTTPTESKTQYDYTVNEAYATTAQ